MSFRHTFITDYLYLAGREDKDQIISGILNLFNDSVTFNGHDGYGYFFGIIKSSAPDLPVISEELESIVLDIGRISPIPFRIVFLLESGPALTYDITPASVLSLSEGSILPTRSGDG